MTLTVDEWDELAFRFGWLPCLIATFAQYYREDEDEDPRATNEMLAECRWIYERLMEQIGTRPAAPPAPPAEDIPF